jgi:peptidyl-prolyl cis-trans isomerase B (cyclophilin B)
MIIIQTNKGIIRLTLDFENTPNTASNFLQYALDKFYDGTLFHRVVKGFVIQGGGLEADMSEKETRAPIENEANTGGKNKRGTIAMARTGMPHSASSQFFINLKDNGFLDFTKETPDGWGYCVFGEVTAGMDVVDDIAAVQVTTKRHYQDVPEEDVIIQSVEVDIDALPETVQKTINE